MNISVLTLVHNRQTTLLNTLTGLAAGNLLPNEVIVVHLNEQPVQLPELPFEVHAVTLHTGKHLNLAAARNYAMSCSSSNFNVFLDVDCVPSVQLLETYQACFTHSDVLWSGKVRYLPEGTTASVGWLDQMEAASKPDPVRADHDHYPYEWFWSLNFGCSAAVFERIEGFDEQFSGYGAEDTDFAFAAREKQVPLRVANATAYHQHHPSYSPPLNHFDAIIRNARVFYKKWGQWPMPGWLEAFSRMDLISLDDHRLEVLRRPTQVEVEGARR